MWLKWLPWRFVLKRVARAGGFVDPIKILSQFNRFSQPGEVLAPVELLRAGAVLHARGLINSQAIQHNLDWIWPWWVVEQFNPDSESFVPRAFSVAHINITHRNWTAVGIPGEEPTPIVDPRGLVTPLFDGWSIDMWVVGADGRGLVPSLAGDVFQHIDISSSPSVVTESRTRDFGLSTRAGAGLVDGTMVCNVTASAETKSEKAWLAVALRPFNPEGVSFVHDIRTLPHGRGWRVNGSDTVLLSRIPDGFACSNYGGGDVFHALGTNGERGNRCGAKGVHCDVGMASAAALFELHPGSAGDVEVVVPLSRPRVSLPNPAHVREPSEQWSQALEGRCEADIPDNRYRGLYETALRTLVLHSPSEVYAGPYTYKRFWFRDAAIIVHALMAAGLVSRARMVIERFFERQRPGGYFESQDGEWDSNGQVLWTLQRYCELSGSAPPAHWQPHVRKAAEWILRKKLDSSDDPFVGGLLPAGFSAEHLGPNDHYYWDNFWSIAGLESAADILAHFATGKKEARKLREGAARYREAVERSLEAVAGKLHHRIMPPSPGRRPDSGSVGSLAAGYPLMLRDAHDPRLLHTAQFLLDNCTRGGGFFHDITHSGINPYLSLHLAQVLLRAGDPRWTGLTDAVASLASPTGRWAEAHHPRTRGGCMGDGEHVWAAAEWVLMMRNCLVREERGTGTERKLVLCGGIPPRLLQRPFTITFGPAPTPWGDITLRVDHSGERTEVSWEGGWFDKPPPVEVRFPGASPVVPCSDEQRVEVGVKT